MGKADSIMTTKELAEYIKLNEKTVIKMAQNGSLPGVKIGNQWRFYLSAIDTHLQGDVLAKSDDELDMIIKTGKNIIPISRLFDPSLIELNLSAKQNKEVLYALSNIAVEGGLTSSVEVLFEQLKKREKLLSTALGNGVAIPHARNPRVGLFTKPRIVMGRFPHGVDFGAPDGEKVFLFFLICPTNAFVHMRLLAKIAKMLHVPNIIQRFKEASGKTDIIRILLELERIRFVTRDA